MFHHFDYAPLGLIPDFLVARGLGVADHMAGWVGYGGLHVQERGRVVMQAVAAYGAVKVLLPLRLAVSLAMAPWFARWTYIPAWQVLTRKKKRAGKEVDVKGKLPDRSAGERSKERTEALGLQK